MGARSAAGRGLIALLAASALLLTGCTSDDPLAEASRGDTGFVSGDGSLTEIPADGRGEPVVFEGISTEGESIRSADFAGDVLVVNFWYAACAPCRAEAPDLQAVHERFDGAGASFVGVNVRDQAANAAAFEKTYGITYPSVIDIDDGTVQLAFAGDVPPNAVPTTLVLDTHGRVAARILGQLRDASILETIVSELIDEGA